MGKHKKTIARETQEKLEDRKQYELTINPLFEPLFQDNLEDPRYYQVYGGRGCFLGSQKVIMKSGKSKEISDIKIGELVQSFNEIESKLESKLVTAVFEYDATHYIKIGLISGEVINCTPNHRFLFKGDWVPIKDILQMLPNADPIDILKVSVRLDDNSIQLQQINSFHYIKQNIKVYDISVEDNHNFLLKSNTGGIVVHNSGKSFTVAVAMVTKTYSQFKHKILFLRQTMSSSEDSTIADVKAVIEKMGVGNDFREANGVITNVSTGSTITFKGIRSTGTQTAKLKSLSGITTLVVEEAEEVESFEEFSKVDESIRIQGKPLKVILIYNPTSSIASWIHKEWFKNGVPMHERLDDTVYIHSTYLDNIENLNESVVKRYRSLERSNPTYYINTILAEWTLEVSGKIYAGWDLYPRFNNIGETWYGLDFGYGGKDKTSLIKITYFEGTYYVEEMFSVAGLKLDDTLKKFKEMEIPYSAKIYADSAMPLLIEVIRLGGYSGIRKCTKGNVDAGIKKVQNKDIVMIGSDKTGLYFAYQTFRHDKNGKLPHEPDELAALRYGINSVRPMVNFKAGVPLRRPMRKTRGFM